MIRSFWSRTRDWIASPGIPIVLALIGIAIVRPWGNFPINDDWQYAHIADTFAKTGEIHIDRPIAPALVVQTILGGTLLRITGTSHVALRALTLVLSMLGLVLIDLLLRHATIGRWRRCLVLMLVAFNPVGFVCSLSFMTEIYGTVPALAAAVIWLRAKDGEAPTLLRALLATSFAALAYLTRQFSGLILPALVGASLLGLWLRGERRLRQFVPHAAGLLFFVAVCAVHWLWNKASQNETEQLAGPMSMLLQPKGAAFPVMGSLALVYLTGFVSPLLVLMPVENRRKVAVAVALTAVAVLAFKFGFERFHARYPQSHFTFDKQMPYLTNVIAPGGIGPYTTIDLYLQKGPAGPHLKPVVWKTAERILLSLILLWPIAVYALFGLKLADWRRWQLAVTGLLFSFGSLNVTLQTYGIDLFDRYLWTVFVGLIIALAALLPDRISLSKVRAPLAILLLAPLVILSVGGTHDYFQWQKSRAFLYKQLLERNISPLSIDAGYELNGWYAYDGWKRNEESPSCVSTCRPDSGTWFARDNSYRISSTRKGHEIVLERIQPRTWLSRMPAILVTRRPDP